LKNAITSSGERGVTQTATGEPAPRESDVTHLGSRRGNKHKNMTARNASRPAGRFRADELVRTQARSRYTGSHITEHGSAMEARAQATFIAAGVDAGDDAHAFLAPWGCAAVW
jgi:hypothetical protein